MNQYNDAVIVISDSEDDGVENHQVAKLGRFNRNQLIDQVIEVFDSDKEMGDYNNGIGE